MKLSLVVPCYNEADSVSLFLDAVLADFAGCGYDYEVIFVNDGSRDRTLFQLKKLYASCVARIASYRKLAGTSARVRLTTSSRKSKTRPGLQKAQDNL